MTKNELYAENMSTSHLSPYFYYFVLCSDRILMLVLIGYLNLHTVSSREDREGTVLTAIKCKPSATVCKTTIF